MYLNFRANNHHFTLNRLNIFQHIITQIIKSPSTRQEALSVDYNVIKS